MLISLFLAEFRVVWRVGGYRMVCSSFVLRPKKLPRPYPSEPEDDQLLEKANEGLKRPLVFML